MDEEVKIRLAVLEARHEEHNKNSNERLKRLEEDFKEFKELITGQYKTINDNLEILNTHKTQTSSIWKTFTIIGASIVGLFTVGKVLFDIFKH